MLLGAGACPAAGRPPVRRRGRHLRPPAVPTSARATQGTATVTAPPKTAPKVAASAPPRGPRNVDRSVETKYLDLRSGHVTRYFPTALGADDFIQRVELALHQYGFTNRNSIAMLNLCRDEVTQTLKHKIDQVFGSSFSTHGLGGVLTCGVTGMGAGLSHSPVCESSGRERYIFFSFPHIAIDSQGAVGNISRPGRSTVSCACGALIKALGEIKRDGLECSCKPPGIHSPLDVEYSILRQRLARRLEAEGASDAAIQQRLDLVELTKVAERSITEDLRLLISRTVDTRVADYAVVTGIQIHNWGTEFDGEEPNLEFVAPTHCVVVVNGEERHLDLSRLPALTPRQIRVLASAPDAHSVSPAAAAGAVCNTAGGSTLREIEPPYQYLSPQGRADVKRRLQRMLEQWPEPAGHKSAILPAAAPPEPPSAAAAARPAAPARLPASPAPAAGTTTPPKAAPAGVTAPSAAAAPPAAAAPAKAASAAPITNGVASTTAVPLAPAAVTKAAAASPSAPTTATPVKPAAAAAPSPPAAVTPAKPAAAAAPSPPAAVTPTKPAAAAVTSPPAAVTPAKPAAAAAPSPPAAAAPTKPAAAAAPSPPAAAAPTKPAAAAAPSPPAAVTPTKPAAAAAPSAATPAAPVKPAVAAAPSAAAPAAPAKPAAAAAPSFATPAAPAKPAAAPTTTFPAPVAPAKQPAAAPRVAAPAAAVAAPSPAAASAVAAPMAAPALVRADFAVSCSVAFGDSVAIVGQPEELGGWDALQGLPLEWSEGDIWTASVDLPPGSVEFKVVKVRYGGVVEWEGGENRLAELPRPTAGSRATYAVKVGPSGVAVGPSVVS